MAKNRKYTFSVDSIYSALCQNLTDMRGVIKEHCYAKHTEFPMYEDLTELYCHWEIENTIKVNNQLGGIQPLLALKSSQLHMLQDIPSILQEYPLFLNIETHWDHLYEERQIQKMLEMTEYEREIIIKVVLLGCVGRLTRKEGFELRQHGPCYGMASLIRNLSGGYLVFVVEVYRFPSVEQREIVSLHYKQFLKVLGMAPFDAVNKTLKQYYDLLKHDSSKWVLPSEVKSQSTTRENWSVQRKKLVISLKTIEFALSEPQRNSFVQDSQTDRWITTAEYTDQILLGNLRDYSVLSKMNHHEFGSLVNPENCKLFIKVLKKLPRFAIQLSDKEIELIGMTGSVLVIGRSGTGKTTSCVLRLFGIEYLYRFYSKKRQISVLGSDKIATVFLSVSPFLCSHAENYYLGLIESGKKLQDSNTSMVSEDVNEKLFSKEDREDYEKIDSGNRIRFPLFISVKLFIYYIDSTVKKPFFIHNLRVQSNQMLWFGKKGEAYVNCNGVPVKSFEIDYEYFNLHFWPRIQTKLNSMTMWTEISSLIKGSPSAFLNDGKIPQEEYFCLGQKITALSPEQKRDAWKIFEKYEKWKKSVNAYDYQDVVNHILHYIHYHTYTGKQIHYLFVDEVQDCTTALLLLLIKITQQSLFFCGDTAQTISEGIGFRFCDLRSLFRNQYIIHNQVSIKQLTTNFRSQNKILCLANSVIGFIQALFPETIDRLQPEVSSHDGSLPAFIEIPDLKLLVDVIRTDIKTNRRRIDFGCEQAILVRDKESQERLHPNLKDSIMNFTILECKGLEFEDVIVFNFFTDSELTDNEWSMLSRITFDDEGVGKAPSNFDKLKFAALCIELKHLYVAITRAKHRVIFFDENLEKRNRIRNLWTSKNLIDLIWDRRAITVEKAGNYEYFETEEEWEKQGEVLFNRKLYAQARLCFSRSKNREREMESDAYFIAEQAEKLYTSIEARKTYQMTKTGNRLSKISEEQFEKQLEKPKRRFEDAANLFAQIGRNHQAALCFNTAGKPDLAIDYYRRDENWVAVGEIYYTFKDYHNALDYFYIPTYKNGIFKCYMEIDIESAVNVFHDWKESLDNEVVRQFIPLYTKHTLMRLTKIVNNSSAVEEEKEEENEDVLEDEEENNSEDEVDDEAPSNLMNNYTELKTDSELETPRRKEEQIENDLEDRVDVIFIEESEEEKVPSERRQKIQEMTINSKIPWNEQSRRNKIEVILQLNQESKFRKMMFKNALISLDISFPQDVSTYIFGTKRATEVFKGIGICGIYENTCRNVNIKTISQSLRRLIELIWTEHKIEVSDKFKRAFSLDSLEIPKNPHFTIDELLFLLEIMWKEGFFQLFGHICYAYGMESILTVKIQRILFANRIPVMKSISRIYDGKVAKSNKTKNDLLIRQLFPCFKCIQFKNENEENKFISNFVATGYWKKVIFKVDYRKGEALALNFFDYNAVFLLEIENSKIDWKKNQLNGSLISTILKKSGRDNYYLKTALLEDCVRKLNEQIGLCTVKDNSMNGDISMILDLIPPEFSCLYSFWALYIGIQGITYKLFTNSINDCYDFLIKLYKDKLEITEKNLIKLKDCLGFMMHLIMAHNGYRFPFLNVIRKFLSERILFCILILLKLLKRTGIQCRRISMSTILDGLCFSIGVKPIHDSLVSAIPFVSYFICSSNCTLIHNTTQGIKNIRDSFCIDVDRKSVLIPYEYILDSLVSMITQFSVDYTRIMLNVVDNKNFEYKIGSSYTKRNDDIRALKICSNNLGISYLFCRIAAVLGYSTKDNMFFKFTSEHSMSLNLYIKENYEKMIMLRKRYPFRFIPLTPWSSKAINLAALSLFSRASIQYDYDDIYWAYSIINKRGCYIQLITARYPSIKQRKILLPLDELLIWPKIDLSIMKGQLVAAIIQLRSIMITLKMHVTSKIAHCFIRLIACIMEGYRFSDEDGHYSNKRRLPNFMYDLYKDYIPSSLKKVCPVDIKLNDSLDKDITRIFLMYLNIQGLRTNSQTINMFLISYFIFKYNLYAEMPASQFSDIIGSINPALYISKKLKKLNIYRDSLPVEEVIRFLYRSDLINRSSSFGARTVDMGSMFKRFEHMKLLQIKNKNAHVFIIAQRPHYYYIPTLLCSRLMIHKTKIKTTIETILKGLSIKLEYDKYESVIKSIQLLERVLFSNIESSTLFRLEIKVQAILNLVAASETNKTS